MHRFEKLPKNEVDALVIVFLHRHAKAGENRKTLADDELKPVMELAEPDLFQNDVVMEHGPIGTFDEMEAE